jgi:hypothetical protein
VGRLEDHRFNEYSPKGILKNGAQPIG